MKNLIFITCCVFLIASLTGCGASVRTYTFKKERPDQDLTYGNKGYVKGTPPPDARTEKAEREWVGVDIELPTKEEFIEETGLKLRK